MHRANRPTRSICLLQSRQDCVSPEGIQGADRHWAIDLLQRQNRDEKTGTTKSTSTSMRRSSLLSLATRNLFRKGAATLLQGACVRFGWYYELDWLIDSFSFEEAFGCWQQIIVVTKITLPCTMYHAFKDDKWIFVTNNTKICMDGCQKQCNFALFTCTRRDDARFSGEPRDWDDEMTLLQARSTTVLVRTLILELATYVTLLVLEYKVVVY